jgi:hypothetical protein
VAAAAAVVVEQAETTASVKTVPLARTTTEPVWRAATAGPVATTTVGRVVKVVAPTVPLATGAAMGPFSAAETMPMKTERAAAVVLGRVAQVAMRAATVRLVDGGDLAERAAVAVAVAVPLVVQPQPGAMASSSLPGSLMSSRLHQATASVIWKLIRRLSVHARRRGLP